MMIVTAGVKVHLALGYTDMQGHGWACDAGSGHAEEGRTLGPSVRLPGQAGAHHQDPVLGRQALSKVAFSLARVCAAMSSASCSKHRFAFKSAVSGFASERLVLAPSTTAYAVASRF